MLCGKEVVEDMNEGVDYGSFDYLYGEQKSPPQDARVAAPGELELGWGRGVAQHASPLSSHFSKLVLPPPNATRGVARASWTRLSEHQPWRKGMFLAPLSLCSFA